MALFLYFILFYLHVLFYTHNMTIYIYVTVLFFVIEVIGTSYHDSSFLGKFKLLFLSA